MTSRTFIRLLLLAFTMLTAITLLAACGPGDGGTGDNGDGTSTGDTDGDSQDSGGDGGSSGDAEPDQRAVVINSVEGEVEVSTGGGSFAPASAGQELFPGDEVHTGEDGSAVLVMDDGTTVVISAESTLVIQQLNGTKEKPITRFLLNAGEIFSLRSTPLPSDGIYEVEMPGQVLAAIRGSAMGATYYPDIEFSEVTCLEGDCAASAGDRTQAIRGGEWLGTFKGTLQPTVQPLTNQQLQRWDLVFEKIKDLPGKPVCTCEGRDSVCSDGTVYTDFTFCVVQQTECACDGTSLVCSDGTIVPDSLRCGYRPVTPSFTAGGNCECEGSTAYCENLTLTFNASQCPAGIYEPDGCACSGSTLVCGDLSYPDAAPCTGVTSTCTCSGSDLLCDNGQIYPAVSYCVAQFSQPGLPPGCVCEGAALTCGGELIADEYPLCTGDWSSLLPPECSCEGADLYCQGALVMAAYPLCTGNFGFPGFGDPCGDMICDEYEQQNRAECPLDCGCICIGTDAVCDDGTIFTNNLSCGGTGGDGNDPNNPYECPPDTGCGG